MLNSRNASLRKPNQKRLAALPPPPCGTSSSTSSVLAASPRPTPRPWPAACSTPTSPARTPTRFPPRRLCAPAQARRVQSAPQHHGAAGAGLRDRADRWRPGIGPRGDDLCGQARDRARARVWRRLGPRAALQRRRRRRDLRGDPGPAGMVGIYGAASSVHHMAPWGGTEPLLGTNPIAVAIPAGDEPPVILDIATSIASNGAIRTHQLEGRPMPEGWVQTRKDGAPITDPSRINEGTYLPMAGHKGYGLSLVIGLLAGPLPRGLRPRHQGFRGAAVERLMSGVSWWRWTSRASSRPSCSRPRSTARFATSLRRGGCRASTRSACPDRAGSHGRKEREKWACR